MPALLVFLRSKKTKAWRQARKGYATPSLLAAFGRHAIACLFSI
jgi:hypothetical protein